MQNSLHTNLKIDRHAQNYVQEFSRKRISMNKAKELLRLLFHLLFTKENLLVHFTLKILSNIWNSLDRAKVSFTEHLSDLFLKENFPLWFSLYSASSTNRLMASFMHFLLTEIAGENFKMLLWTSKNTFFYCNIADFN